MLLRLVTINLQYAPCSLPGAPPPSFRQKIVHAQQVQHLLVHRLHVLVVYRRPIDQVRTLQRTASRSLRDWPRRATSSYFHRHDMDSMTFAAVGVQTPQLRSTFHDCMALAVRLFHHMNSSCGQFIRWNSTIVQPLVGYQMFGIACPRSPIINASKHSSDVGIPWPPRKTHSI